MTSPGTPFGAATARQVFLRPGALGVAAPHDDASALRILLVSDNAQLRTQMNALLAADRYVVVAVGGAAPLAHRHSAGWDAAIVDAAAAHGAARWLRALAATRVPILALAAARSGAAIELVWSRVDAVLHEPFDARKLSLVLRGLFAGRRSAAAHPGNNELTIGPMTLRSLLNTVTVESREIALTDAETRILHELLLHAGKPLSRERLTRRGLLRDWSPDDRCLDAHIKRLRRKLGPDRFGRTPLRTVRGVGYRLVAEWEPAR